VEQEVPVVQVVMEEMEEMVLPLVLEVQEEPLVRVVPAQLEL
jgi:hypothetical protein